MFGVPEVQFFKEFQMKQTKKHFYFFLLIIRNRKKSAGEQEKRKTKPNNFNQFEDLYPNIDKTNTSQVYVDILK